MNNLSLNGKWKFRKTINSDWMDGTVPGSVFNDLLNRGKIDDPFYRDNEDQAKEIAPYDYEYIRDFHMDSMMMKHDRLFLHCDGLDTLAEIIINGKTVANTSNMHRTYDFDIKKLVREGRNNIRIVLFSPVKFIEEKHKRNPI